MFVVVIAQVRKKTSQVASLERQLDDKVAELSENVSATSDLEKSLAERMTEVYEVNKQHMEAHSFSLKCLREK